MSRPRPSLLCALLLACLMPAGASAQSEAPPPASPAPAPESSKLWLVVGGAFATLRSECEAPPSPLSPVTCGASPYRHSGSVLVNVGYRVSHRVDVGAEVFWMPLNAAGGRIRVTHFDAVAQFRPWASQGFFIKGGAGMALLRNWVDAIGSEAINQKALSVIIGGGWAFRRDARLGLQFFAEQHAGAIGDVQTAEGPYENVTGNFWSLGVAVVIR